MFKVRQYKDVVDYSRRNLLEVVLVLTTLAFGFCKTNFLISLISLYLMITYTLIKCIALTQAIDVTDEKNTKFSWLTRARYIVQ